MGTSAIYVTTPQIKQVNISQGNTQAILYTAGASGSKITGIFASSNDASIDNVILWLGSNTAQLCRFAVVPVAINAGSNSTIPTASFFTSSQMPALPVDNDGQEYLFLAPSGLTQLWAQTTANVAASPTVLCLSVIGGDF